MKQISFFYVQCPIKIEIKTKLKNQNYGTQFRTTQWKNKFREYA